jgi:hypothetical protein
VRLTFRVEDDTSGQVVLSSVIWGKRAMRLRQEQKGRGVIRCNGEAGWLQTYPFGFSKWMGTPPTHPATHPENAYACLEFFQPQ